MRSRKSCWQTARRCMSRKVSLPSKRSFWRHRCHRSADPSSRTRPPKGPHLVTQKPKGECVVMNSINSEQPAAPHHSVDRWTEQATVHIPFPTVQTLALRLPWRSEVESVTNGLDNL